MNGNKRDINKNIKITLLSSKDLFKKENNLIISNNLTNTFKNIGIRSAASDLALINGSFAIDEEYVDCNQRLNNRSVSYYLKDNYGSYNLLITLEGTISWVDNNIYNVGIRPVLEFEDFPIEIFERLFNFNGSSYVYFGEYPQVVAPNQQLLKYLVGADKVYYTDREYRTKIEWYSNMLSYVGYKEFEYNGEKYIKAKIDIEDFYKVTLSNGQKYKKNDTVILKVVPILWLVDIKNKRLISNNIITSGIRFTNQKRTVEDFSNTEISNYLNNYLLEDMIYQSEDYQEIYHNYKIKVKNK